MDLGKPPLFEELTANIWNLARGSSCRQRAWQLENAAFIADPKLYEIRNLGNCCQGVWKSDWDTSTRAWLSAFEQIGAVMTSQMEAENIFILMRYSYLECWEACFLPKVSYKYMTKWKNAFNYWMWSSLLDSHNLKRSWLCCQSLWGSGSVLQSEKSDLFCIVFVSLKQR